MLIRKLLGLVGLAASSLLILGVAVFAQTPQNLLNISCGPSRELNKDINPAFIARGKAKTGNLITMNHSPDIDILIERGGLLADGANRDQIIEGC